MIAANGTAVVAPLLNRRFRARCADCLEGAGCIDENGGNCELPLQMLA